MSEQSFGCTGGTAFVGLPRRRTALSHEGLDAQDLSLSLSSDAFSWCASGLLRAADEELTDEKHGHDAERLAQQAAVRRGVDAVAHPHSYDDRLEHAGGKTEGDAEDCALPLHPLAMAATEAIEVEVEQHHERQHQKEGSGGAAISSRVPSHAPTAIATGRNQNSRSTSRSAAPRSPEISTSTSVTGASNAMADLMSRFLDFAQPRS